MENKIEEIIQDITEGKIKSAYLEAPFDEGKVELEKAGYKIISLEENAKLRIQEGKDAFISKNSNWVREGVVYIPKKGRFLTKNSPVLKNLRQATISHTNRNKYHITNKQVENVLKNSIRVPYNVGGIPTNRFGEDEITNFCFGKIAQDYGLFLKENEIETMCLVLNLERAVNCEKSSYANQLEISRLEARVGSTLWSSYCLNREGLLELIDSYDGVHVIGSFSRVRGVK